MFLFFISNKYKYHIWVFEVISMNKCRFSNILFRLTIIMVPILGISILSIIIGVPFRDPSHTEGQEYNNQNISINNISSPIDSSREIIQKGIVSEGVNLPPCRDEGMGKLLIDPDEDKIYYADIYNENDNSILAINLSTNRIIKDIKVKYEARDASLHPFSNKIFITDRKNDTINIIDIDSGKTTNTIPIKNPELISINPKTNLVYVSNSSYNAATDEETNSLIEINGTDGKINQMLLVNGSVKDLNIDTNTNKIYFLGRNGIEVVDAYKLSLLTTIPVPDETIDIDINEETNTIYATTYDADRMFAINGSTNKIIKTILGNNSASNIYESAEISIDPTSNLIFVSERDSNSIHIINGTHNNIEKTITLSDEPINLALNPKTHFLYFHSAGCSQLKMLNVNDLITSDLGNSIPINEVGIKTRPFPFSSIVSENSGNVYVIYGDSMVVDIIDGDTDLITGSIAINHTTSAIDIDQRRNIIYASGTNTISVIDAYTNSVIHQIVLDDKTLNIRDILVSPVDGSPRDNYLYVHATDSNLENDKILEIYIPEKELINTLNLTDFGGFTFDIHKDILYLTNTNTSTIYTDEEPADEIYLNDSSGYFASNMAVNPLTGLVYAGDDSNVYVLDFYFHNVSGVIPVDDFPGDIAINSLTNMLYIADVNRNIVLVVDASTNQRIGSIAVGKSPTSITINPYNNRIYVTNYDSNTISIIDGLTNKVIVGISMNIFPPNAGHISCQGEDVTTGAHIQVEYGTTCVPTSNDGFAFTSWSKNLGYNSSKTIKTFENSISPIDQLMQFLRLKSDDRDISTNLEAVEYGDFVANFRPVPSPIPQEYFIPLYGFMVSSIIGWMIPNIAISVNGKRRRQNLRSFMVQIDDINKCLLLVNCDNYNNLDSMFAKLNDLTNHVTFAFEKGRISEFHYSLLKNKVSESYEECYRIRINCLNKSYDASNKEYGRKLKDTIEQLDDDYSKGKITESHFTLLKEKIQSNRDR